MIDDVQTCCLLYESQKKYSFHPKGSVHEWALNARSHVCGLFNPNSCVATNTYPVVPFTSTKITKRNNTDHGINSQHTFAALIPPPIELFICLAAASSDTPLSNRHSSSQDPFGNTASYNSNIRSNGHNVPHCGITNGIASTSVRFRYTICTYDIPLPRPRRSSNNRALANGGKCGGYTPHHGGGGGDKKMP